MRPASFSSGCLKFLCLVAVFFAFFNGGPDGGAIGETVITVDEIREEIERRQAGGEPHDARNPALAKLSNEELRKLINDTGIERKAIYGPDDRVEWHEIPISAQSIALASVALVKPADISKTGKRYELRTRTLEDTVRLCPGERFGKQPTAAFCSGVLIKDNLLLTAGHCVREIAQTSISVPAADIHFVFGFKIADPNHGAETVFTEDQVYTGGTVVGGAVKGRAWIGGRLQDITDDREDWAAIRLTGAVASGVAGPVTALRQTDVEQDDAVFVIGYPSRLPLKYAPGATVRQLQPSFFVANLDTFGGNSGSGVFDGQNRLAGILVRGETDYVRASDSRACNIANICPTSGCRGEDVTRISLIKSRLGLQ
jgi:hypothetical protein